MASDTKDTNGVKDAKGKKGRKTIPAIPDDLWRRLRAYSLLVGRPMSNVLTCALEQYLEDFGKQQPISNTVNNPPNKPQPTRKLPSPEYLDFLEEERNK